MAAVLRRLALTMLGTGVTVPAQDPGDNQAPVFTLHEVPGREQLAPPGAAAASSQPQALAIKGRRAIDHGFGVERAYEGAVREDNVRRGDDGSWRIRPGALVRVRARIVTPIARNHAAIVDPLPAGFEIESPAAAIESTARSRIWAKLSGTPSPEQRSFDSVGLRDDRAEAFAVHLREGVHELVYFVRATTPGTFAAPPARAEEMYQPEVFGEGPGDVVVIAPD